MHSNQNNGAPSSPNQNVGPSYRNYYLNRHVGGKGEAVSWTLPVDEILLQKIDRSIL